jgi:hypothetical protein
MGRGGEKSLVRGTNHSIEGSGGSRNFGVQAATRPLTLQERPNQAQVWLHVAQAEDVPVGILEPHAFHVPEDVHVSLACRVRQIVVVLERDAL